MSDLAPNADKIFINFFIKENDDFILLAYLLAVLNSAVICYPERQNKALGSMRTNFLSIGCSLMWKKERPNFELKIHKRSF